MTSPQGNSAKPESPTEIIKIISSLSESRARYENLLGRLWKTCDKLKGYAPTPESKDSVPTSPSDIGLIQDLFNEANWYERLNDTLASYVNKLEELI